MPEGGWVSEAVPRADPPTLAVDTQPRLRQDMAVTAPSLLPATGPAHLHRGIQCFQGKDKARRNLLRNGDCAVPSTARAGPRGRGCLGLLSPTDFEASFSVWGPAMSSSATCPLPGAALPHPSHVGWALAWV